MPAAVKAEHHPGLSIRAFARNRQRVDRAIRVGNHAVRCRLRCGGKDHIDHPQDRFGIAADRRREGGGQQRSFGDLHLDRAHHTGVGGQAGKDMFDRDIGRRHRRGERDIDRPCTAVCRAGEIQQHLIALDLERDLDRQRRIGDAVVIEKILCLPASIWQVCQLCPHQGLGAVLQRIQRRAHSVGTVFRQQLVQTFLAQIKRAELAVQIALGRLRQAGVAHQDVDNVGLDLARFGKTHRGQDEGFLEGVGCGGVVVARHRAAHIMPMPDRGEIAKQFAVVKIGAHQPHVGQVRAAQMGIVEDIDVAVFQIAILGRFVDHRLHGK